MSVFRQLLSAGLLSVDMGQYAGIRLTKDSWPVLKGERTVFFRKDSVYSKTKTGKKPFKTVERIFDNEENQLLFERLRKLRLNISKQLAVPPYIIFPDKSLKEMAAVKPASVADFLQITGVGESKAQRYSAVFLDCIRGVRIDLSHYIEDIQAQE